MGVENPTDWQKLRKDRAKLLRCLEAELKRYDPYKDRKDKDICIIKSIIQAIRTDVDKYVSYSQDNTIQISYARRPEDRYDNRRRVKTTLQRYIRRVIGITEEQMPDHFLDKFCQPLFAKQFAMQDSDKFEVLVGPDIQEAYADSVGDISCMTGDGGKFVELYALNPDKVGLLVYRGVATARALLWTCDDGVKVVDRVYPHGGVTQEIFKEYAIIKGWVYRQERGVRTFSGVSVSDGKEHQVTVKWKTYFPYVDTFCYAKIDTKAKTAILYNSGNSPYDYVLTETDGGPINPDYECECYECGEGISEDDTWYFDGDPYCNDCFHKYFDECACCGESYRRDDMSEVDECDFWCEHCIEGRANYCEGHSGYTTQDGKYTEDTGCFYCDDCISDGNVNICEDCGSIFEREKYLIECNDGVTRCTDCRTECSKCGTFVSIDVVDNDGKCEDCEAEDKSS